MDSSLFRLAQPTSSSLDPSATLMINERVKRMWAEGQTVYHLGFGESRMPIHERLLSALRENSNRKSYLACQGLAELRESVAGFYQRQFQIATTPDRILIGPGSKAILFALQLALKADVLLPTPSWVSYAPQADLLGSPVRFIQGTIKDHYELNVDALDRAATASGDQPKLLVINSPNNPTGQMLSENQLRDIAEYCRKHQIVVISDEIYAMTAGREVPHISIATYYPEGTVVVGGISKHLSLGGWRLGVAVVPSTPEGAALMDMLCTIASETWSSPSTPIQYAAITAYADDSVITAYIDECNRVHQIRNRHVWNSLTRLGINCTEPQGGFYSIANFDRWRTELAQRNIKTSTDLADYLLDRFQLAVLPGTSFGIPSTELSLRLATSYLDMETDEKAKSLMTAFRSGLDEQTLAQEHLPMMNRAIGQFEKLVAELSR